METWGTIVTEHDHGPWEAPIAISPPWMMPCGLGRPSPSLGRLDVTTRVALMMCYLHFSIL
jgi:hypothetical protein